ncbi:L domain-like protein [Wallemia mellicola]|nr:L domain-like protein [Wallemia mellicola]TIC73150.1 L domain-like protein [Wallemia mellicola]
MDEIEDDNLSVNWDSQSSNPNSNSIKSSNSLVNAKSNNPLDLENIFNNFKFTFNSTIDIPQQVQKSPTKSLFGQTNIDALVDELDIASNSSSNSLQTEQAKKKLKLSNNASSFTKDVSLFEPLHKSDRDILKEANQFMDLLRFNDSDTSPFKTSTPVNDDINSLKLRNNNHFNIDSIKKSKSHNDIFQQIQDMNSTEPYQSTSSIQSRQSQYTAQKVPGPTSMKFVEPDDYPYKEEYGNYVFDRNLKKWMPRDGFSDSDSESDPFEGIESLGEEPRSSIRSLRNPRSALKSSSTNTPARSVSFKQPSPKSLRKSSIKNKQALRDVFNDNAATSPASEFFRSNSLSKADTSSLFHKTLSELSNEEITINFTTSANLSSKKINNLIKLGVEADNLQYLNLSKNNIKSVLPLKSFKHLRQLNLDSNKIESLEGLDEIKGLQKLTVKNNLLYALDFYNYEWSKLEFLDLSNNNLIEIKSLAHLSNISFLSLDNNSLKDIQFVTEFDKLKVLRLSNNKLKELDISKILNVRTLFIDNNKLRSLLNVSALKKLENLSSREQKGQYFELSMKDIRDIKRLYLSGNKLPKTFTAEYCYHLEYLEIAKCGLKSIPDNFSRVCPNLRVLNLNLNFIDNLKPLKNLRRLRRLSLVCCSIDKFDYEMLKSLEELEILDLRLNPLTEGLYSSELEYNYRLSLQNDSNYQEWLTKDKIFTDEEITDENFIKRVAYRGLIMTNSESLKLLDGLYLTNRDQLKASKLSELFKNLKM